MRACALPRHIAGFPVRGQGNFASDGCDPGSRKLTAWSATAVWWGAELYDARNVLRIGEDILDKLSSRGSLSMLS